MTSVDEMLTIGEAERDYGVRRSTLYQYIRRCGFQKF